MSEMLLTQEDIPPLADEGLPPLHTSEYLERAQTLEEFVSTYSQLMDSTVANHEAAFDSLQSLPDREGTHLLDATDAGVHAREQLDTTLQLTTDEVTDIMDGAARAVKSLLLPEDKWVFQQAESASWLPGSGQYLRDQALDRASSPLARQAMSFALDAGQLRKAREARYYDFTDGYTLEYINRQIGAASSPAAQQAIRAAMDGDILEKARIIRSSWPNGTNYTENALNKLFNQTSGPTVRLVLAERAEAAAKGMWDPKPSTKKTRLESTIFGEGVTAEQFIFDLFSNYSAYSQDSTDTSSQTHAGEAYKQQPPDNAAEDDYESEDEEAFDSRSFFSNFYTNRQREQQREEDEARKRRDDHHMDEAPEVNVDPEVEQVISSVQQKNRSYGWLASEDPGQIKDAVDYVHTMRKENPGISDEKIYRDAFLRQNKGETSSTGTDNADSEDVARFKIIEAMMAGEGRRGTLPVEEQEKQQPRETASEPASEPEE